MPDPRALVVLWAALAAAVWVTRPSSTTASESPILADVRGAVERPGVHPVHPPVVGALVAAAGGPPLDPRFANRRVVEGDRWRVTADGTVTREPGSPLLFGHRVRIGRDDRQALMQLPGIGARVAAAIEGDAPYASRQDLDRARGVGPKLVAGLAGWVALPEAPPASISSSSAGPASRVDVNHADAAELERLPGIGPSLAARIVDDRQRRGPFRSVRDLDRVRGIGPATVARLSGLVEVR